MTDSRRRNILWLAGLLVVVAGFLYPAVSLRAPTCYCDAPVESVPRVFAIARAIQSGGLPLWDSATFAGARPFYVTNESAPFYPPLYPFYALAPLANLEASTLWLVSLPYMLHLLWAAAGAFAFARMVLGAPPLAAALCGLLWSLSPEMAVQIHTPDVAYLFAHLPWALLALQRFLQTGSSRWWLTATIILGLLVAVGTLNFTLRVLFVSATTTFAIWLSLRRPGGLMRLIQAAMAFVLGIGLNSFAFAGVLEGLGWLQAQLGPLTTESAADLLAESSMPPSYVATLFVPTFFGVLDSRHTWGVALAEGVTNLSALSGGMALMTAVVAALALALRRGACSRSEARLRWWARFALGVQVLALLTMMGRYTPVFDVLCAILPWFFRIPHAVYYRFAQCWSVALLAAIGIAALARGNIQPRARLVGVCVLLALAALAPPLLQAKPDESEYIAAYKQLFDLGEGEWFAQGPLAYFAGAVTGLMLLFSVAPRRWRAPTLAVAIATESVGFGIPAFYESLLFESLREPPEFAIDVQDRRYRTAAEHPHAAIGAEVVQRSAAAGSRYVGYNSRVDNQAWLFGGRALFGYSSKPLEPRFAAVTRELTRGMPYDLMWTSLPVPATAPGPLAQLPQNGAERTTPVEAFLRNMNVGFVVGRLGVSPEWMHQTEGLSLHPLPPPLPLVYVQDRGVELQDDEQRRQLLAGDLRRAVYVDTGDTIGLAPGATGTAAASPEEVARFTALQHANPILAFDAARANRKRISVHASTSLVVVINEVWHPGWTATVDGHAAPVLRVNYLQQAVRVAPGEHVIEMRFLPANLWWGGAIGLACCGVLALVALAGWRRPS